jgi:asparagine synthase (glutamine-hydrolysing)
MCGIAGMLRFDGAPIPEQFAAAVSRKLAHRGPDGSGVWERGPVSLVHRRLAIIDLQTGDQPMRRQDLGLVVCFNGEIYNYLELREELQQLGHRFETRSDTEVLLVGFAAWGEKLLERLRGMYAFALWDERKQSLWLVRDPLGKKPLHLLHRPGEFLAFASEAKALLELPGCSRRVNPQALAQYLDLMYVPDQTRVWADIERLQAGSWLRASPSDPRRLEQQRFWSPKLESVDRPVTDRDAAEAVKAALARATQIRLRSDVPLGIFLSGGIDSTLVALAAADAGVSKLRTFTVGFEGSDDTDERPFAREVAKKIGSEHLEIDVRLSGPALVTEVARAYDEPFGDTSALPSLAMARATKPHATVVLSGDGGDEMFGGYDTYLRHIAAGAQVGSASFARQLFGRAIAQLRTAARAMPAPISARIAALARSRRAQLDSFADSRNTDPVERQVEMMRVNKLQKPEAALAPILHGQTTGFAEIAASIPRQPSALRSAMLFDQLVYLPGDILKKVDIANMAAAVEARAPLLDEDVIALAASLPPRLLAFAGVNEPRTAWGKRVLKQLCADRMGSEFTYRPKRGFALPLQDWLDRPEFAALIGDGFAASTSPIKPWFSGAGPGKIWQEFRAGKRWLAQEVWNLIMLDAWAREYRPVVQ